MAEQDQKKSDSAVAVALSHEKGSSKAPIVTATGRGAVAEQILDIAFQNGVKVREDANLAQILAEVDVDSPIPLEAFAAVSEILTYLYRAQNDPAPAPEFKETDPVDDE
ncbi:flagellar protein FhlB [Sneathiella sp. P13V-1]|uniref:EscU/YscU/HrcU family type III secretion system export apparatus switch protein n=1 Tax=Sneathiella sp. P13V-1 TaxID=2697366 RepID=UPI00187B52EB|nr:EscU/YscU/HrcU family type III secretion system export apparatus switch protein [Sneathiella sp. P13V-1]MBE7638367.1 flagellar protein FhlB [Sneathiella sp. P13V-1]